MSVFIQSRQRAFRPVEPLRILAQKILQRLERSEVELGLILINDRQIRVLNRKYRGKDRPTDVLAFPLSLNPRIIKGKSQRVPHLLGDVVISVKTARRQAREFGHDIFQEMGRLLIHGTLHLIGYDHEKLRDARRMQRIERGLAKELLRLKAKV